MPNISVSINYEGASVSLASLSQNLNMASKVDIVTPTTQDQGLQLPRIPGSGKEHILQVAPDFDAPIELER